MSPRGGTVAPLAAAVPRDFVLHQTQKQTESYSATEAVYLFLSVVDTYTWRHFPDEQTREMPDIRSAF